MKMKIDDLEDRILPKIEIMKKFENKVNVEDETIGKIVVYVGNVYGLIYYNGCLSGQASMIRNDVREDGLEINEWKVKTKEDGLFSPYQFISLYNDIILSTNVYRNELKNRANERDLVIKDKLFSLVFDPIDNELVELFKCIRENKMDDIEYNLLKE